jgi:hypothetical protein
MTGRQVKTTKMAYINNEIPPPFYAPTWKTDRLLPTIEPAAAEIKPNF